MRSGILQLLGYAVLHDLFGKQTILKEALNGFQLHQFQGQDVHSAS